MVSANQIAEQCYIYEKQSGVKVTSNAQQLLQVVLSGIADDPHPSWQVGGRNELQVQTNNYVRDLPKILEGVFLNARKIYPPMEKIRVLSTFDLAHQMTDVVNIVCGIKKYPRIRTL